MSQTENLLSLLHNNFRPGRTVYGLEDLMTAYLGWLMREDAGIREKIVRLATGVDLDFSNVEVKNQEPIVGGRLDLVVRGGQEDRRWCLVVEAKVDSELRSDQLEDYDDWLHSPANEADTRGGAFLCTLTRARACQGIRDDWLGRGAFSRAVSWARVHDFLSGWVEQRRKNAAPGAGKAAVEFAGWFVELLEEHGMTLPKPLTPVEFPRLYEEKAKYEKFTENAAKLVWESLEWSDSAEQPEPHTVGLLKSLGFEHRIYQPMVHNLQELDSQLRAVFNMVGRPDTFFFFGYRMDGLDEFVRPRDRTLLDLDDGSAKLIAAYETSDRDAVTKRFAEKENLKEAEKWCKAMNARLAGGGESGRPDYPIFIPQNTTWAKFVRLHDMGGWAGLEADDQIEQMKTFFREFVEAFDATVGTPGERVLQKLKHLETSQTS